MRTPPFNLLLRSLLFYFLCFTHAYAQETQKSDSIHLTDGTVIKALVEEIGEKEIRYKAFPVTGESVLSVPVSKVVKVIFSNGDEELFTSKGAVEQVKSSPQTAKAETASTIDTPLPGTLELPKKLSVGVYVQPDFLVGGSPYWKSNREGFGLDRNLGFGMTFGYRISPKIGVALSAGYANWTLLRNYTEEGQFLYKEEVNLLRVPALIGLRYYLSNNIYIMPEAGTSFLKSKTTTTEFGEQVVAADQITFPVSYGAAIGFEKKAGPILLDLSGRYQFTGHEDGQLASVRLGISFLVK